MAGKSHTKDTITMIRKFIVGSAMAVTLAFGATAPAFAVGAQDTGGKAPVSVEQKAARCAAATDRIARIEARLAKAPGAIAKLQAALDQATAENNSEKAAKIQARIAKADGRVATATTRLAEAKTKVANKCASDAS
jgi:hypothetical protein